MIRVVLCWLALGTKLAWKKGQRGQSFEWIGAYFRKWRTSHNDGVRVGISAERIQKYRCNARR